MNLGTTLDAIAWAYGRIMGYRKNTAYTQWESSYWIYNASASGNVFDT